MNPASTVLFVTCIHISSQRVVVIQAGLWCCCRTVQSHIALLILQMQRQAELSFDVHAVDRAISGDL